MIDVFILKKILSLFVHLVPGAFFLLFLLLIGRRWYPRLCQTLAVVLCVSLIAASTPPVSNHFVSKLEGRYPVLQSLPEDTAIILVLGYGHRYADDRPANSALSSTALSRLMEGVRLWQMNTEAMLAVSGARFSGHMSQAQASKNMALELGVPANKILLFDEAQDTADEVTAVAAALTAAPAAKTSDLTSVSAENQNERVVVVSTALHLPRAALMLEDSGLLYSLAPTDFHAIGAPWYLPGSGFLMSLDQAIHEWVGMLWYRLNKLLSG